MTDPTTYRAESRKRWARSATGWQARRDAFRRATMPVSAWLVDAIAPAPGDQVLELAAGVGDTGFLAAELIEPGGTLTSSDFVPEMLTVAQARATELGIDNVRFRQIDAESIDVETGSLDAVVCRWGLMLMADPEAAVRECRRVLRPGGRLAVAAWSAPEDNPWSAAPAAALEARDFYPPPDPDAPGQFAWAREGVLAEHLDVAGFAEHTVQALSFAFTYASAADWLQATAETSVRFADLRAQLDLAEREEVEALFASLAEPFAEADGGLRIPAATWVAYAPA